MNDIARFNNSVKKLIKNTKLITDPWCYDAGGESSNSSNNSPCIVTLEYWQQERETLRIKKEGLGIRLSGETDILDSELLQNLPSIDLIAIEFTAFTDGRGFSLAAQLRQYGFQGELRATGSILLDQLNYLQRCGFDAFEIGPDDDIDLALSALGAFSQSYQSGW